MFLIVGLGNPGSEYEDTRHNIGFSVLDAIATNYKVYFKAGRGEFLKAEFTDGGEDILLIKPLTYMNNSGIAVIEVLEHYDELRNNRMLVVYDDFQLPLGAVRIRQAGSDGGHNGLGSIIYHLQSDEFPRLRCGIKSESMPSTRDDKVDFVLSKFTAGELPAVRTMIQKASEACMAAATGSIEQAMNRYNNTSV